MDNVLAKGARFKMACFRAKKCAVEDVQSAFTNSSKVFLKIGFSIESVE